MDTRKVTLVATIAVIALVAVGIGYAYTASTVNSGNDVSSEYLLIVPNDGTTESYTGALSKNIAYDTVKSDGYIDYSITEGMQVDYPGEDNKKVTIVGPMYIYIDQTKSNAQSYTLNIKATSGTIDTTNFAYRVSYASGAGADQAAAKTAADGAAATNAVFVPTTGIDTSSQTNTHNINCIKITLYVGLSEGENAIANSIHVADNQSPLPLPTAAMSNVTFTFKADTGGNPATPESANQAVWITQGANMTLTSGSLTQFVSSAVITPIELTAAQGYQFVPATYMGGINGTVINGLTITVTSSTITISGTPTDNVNLVLDAATAVPAQG